MKKLFFYIFIILSNSLWGQATEKTRIFYSNSSQLEEIFYDFITEERNEPYYSDSLTYQLIITIYDSLYLCEFRAGISYYRNDSIFIEDEYLYRTPQQYVLLKNRFVQAYIYNEGTQPPFLPFIIRSDDYCTVVGITSNNQYDDMIDDSIIPAVWEFSYANEKFQIIRKIGATH